jgi:hypothetical protein
MTRPNSHPPENPESPGLSNEELVLFLRGLKAWHAAAGETWEAPGDDSCDMGTGVSQ